MLDPKLAPLAVLALVSLPIAGCVAGDDGGSFTVPDDAGPVAREASVDEPHQLVVNVHQETREGVELPGVAVFFFHEAGETRSTADVSAEGEAGEGQARGDVDIRIDLDADDEVTAVAAGRTATNGTVTGLLAPNTTVDVLVGGATGFTNEVRYDVPLGEPGGRTEITVPLFHDRFDVNASSTMETEVSGYEATGGQTERGQTTVEVPLGSMPEVETAYLERLAALDAELSWTNEPPTHADLYAGWGAGEQVLVTGEDTRQTPGEGEVAEHLSLDEGTIDEHRETLVNTGRMSLFALTDNIAASPPDGVAFTLDATATFQGTGHAYEIR